MSQGEPAGVGCLSHVRRGTLMVDLLKVYVAQLDLPEGKDAWLPVAAQHLDGELYRLIGRLPPDRVWEFSAGDLVQCRLKVFAPGIAGFVAYAKVDDRA